jgi:hypothetical protein
MHITKNSTTRKLLISVFFVALLALLTQVGSRVRVLAQHQTKSDTFKQLSDIPAQSQQVETGIFVMNLYDLDISSNTCSLDFYVWFKWKGNIDPTPNLEYFNGVSDSNTTSVPLYKKPEKLSDGRFYQAMRVEGRFVQPFALAKYPLDQQNLTIWLENSVYTVDQMVYVADNKQSGYSSKILIPGWEIQVADVSSLVHEYTTNFGDPRLGDITQYSILQYSLTISRPMSFFVWKLLLPLVIVVAASWGALLLKPQYVDSRIALSVTTLLTTVFLQQSYSSTLPNIGYLVLLDKVYALAYVLITISILEAIVTADWVKDEKPESYARVVRLDRTLLAIQIVVFVGGVGLLLLLS